MSGSDRAFLPGDGSAIALASRGFAEVYPDLVEVHEEPLYILARARAGDRTVGLVSGGGSGHEPLHSGFLGIGMLDAVVPGQVFASPHNGQILAASRAAAGPDGVLHIVKNYTGDRINFGIAAERLRREDIDVARVLVEDDLATDSDTALTGRRGTAATVFVEKLLGAAADRGASLQELATLGERVAAASRSIAVASRAHTNLEEGSPAFSLDGEQIEYGVGIHGERAVRTMTRPPLEQLINRMVGELGEALGLGTGAEILLLVNGLGGTTLLELGALRALVGDQLRDLGVTVAGSLAGTYVSALDMRGFSLTVTVLEPEWRALWDAPVLTAALTKGTLS